jgi:alcohol dehydrogenase
MTRFPASGPGDGEHAVLSAREPGPGRGALSGCPMCRAAGRPGRALARRRAGGQTRRMTGIYRHRPRGALRHYAGLLGPSGAVAGRVVIERDLPLRVARLKGAVRSRRARTEPMRALVASAGGRLRWRPARAPGRPVPLGANVRPLAMATCDLDRPLMLGATPFPLPLQLGHECVAEVIAVGGEVRTVVPGQRVVVPFQISCGTCPPCLAGRTGNCAAVPPTSMYGFGIAGGLWGGVIADQVAVPFADAMLVPLPDGIDVLAAASVADNVSDGYRHVAPYLPALLAEDAAAPVLIVGAPCATGPGNLVLPR